MRTVLYAIVLVVGFAAATSHVSAAVPPAPAGLSASVRTGTAVPGSIYVQWFLVDSIDVDPATTGTRLYMARSIPGAMTFGVIDNQSANGRYHSSTVTLSDSGVYLFYATQYNADGESAGSDTISVTFPDPPPTKKVVFPGEFPLSPNFRDTARTLAPYSYDHFQARGQGFTDNAVRYAIAYADIAGPVIDSLSGVFAWANPVDGIFNFTVRARSVEDQAYFADARFQLIVDTADRTPYRVILVRGRGGTIGLNAGETFRDTVEVIGSDGLPAWTRLIGGGPAGLTYDSAAGLMTWVAEYNAASRGYVRVSLAAGRIGSAGIVNTFQYDFYVRDVNDHQSILGHVVDSVARAPVPAVVRLYGNVPRAGTTGYPLVAEQHSASDGTFAFVELDGGDYILQVVPDNAQLRTGYYVRGQVVATAWDRATLVQLFPNGWSDTAIIRVGSINGTQGSNGLHGTITHSGGVIRKGGDRNLAGLEPLFGAAIYAFDQSGRVSACDITDSSGAFELASIGAGDYTIVADKPGYQPLTQIVSFTNDDDTDLNIDLNLDAISGVPSGAEFVGRVTAAPNPASQTVSVTFGADGLPVTLCLIDYLGREVMRQNAATGVGPATVHLDVSGLGCGRYIVTIVGTQVIGAVPVIVAR